MGHESSRAPNGRKATDLRCLSELVEVTNRILQSVNMLFIEPDRRIPGVEHQGSRLDDSFEIDSRMVGQQHNAINR